MTHSVDVSHTNLSGLTASQVNALGVLAKYLGPQLRANAALALAPPESITDFGATHFYVPETSTPIDLLPHQRLILRLMFDASLAPHLGVPNGFQTMVFSTIKKSGKTTIAALAARWVAETWGKFNEVYSIANDKEQSRGRVYAKALQSIQLDPRYDSHKQTIPDYWRIIEREATHLPSGSYLRAVSNDYKGEAGANPTATFWSELWGYTLENSRRLWDELTPVPTRPRSIRFVETYAGFERESTLLIKLYEMVTHPDRGARRLTREDLAALTPPLEWPFPVSRDPRLPIFVNPTARSIAYWDDSPAARRMPWQTPEYYAAQAAEMRPEVFDRLHNNYWVSSTSSFVPPQWWAACRSLPSDAIQPLVQTPNEPLVVAADASVTGDCTALVAVSRNPNNRKQTIARLAKHWTPTPDHPMNYNAPDGLKDTIRDWVRRFNVVELAYDPYQLHEVMTQLRDEGLVWTRPFSQGEERMVADFGLYTSIRDRTILDDAQYEPLGDHLSNADARISKDDITKLRLIKKAADRKIDLAVTLSMARAECLRLMLD